MWGCVAMLVFNIGLGATGSADTPSSHSAALAMIILWIISYGLSTAPIGFASAGETSTPRLRAKTTSFNLTVFAAVYLIFQWTVPYMIAPDAANLGV
ncbi:hypothetical protein M231_04615 [Tremella mesenterica]|uniref:Uncharacterized protein n=1 Tax=Tremella mesenterica TaxID=5217 RepID=A0A4Q1BK54_TREME|nr:hypothetical protein M231_04615 [Tremella mesenterica]